MLQPSKTEPVAIIKEIKNTPTTNVSNKARWIVNKAALEYVEDLQLPNGEAALKTIDSTDGGVNYMLVGFLLDCTDVVKGSAAQATTTALADAKIEAEADPTNEELADAVAVFYFGDFSSFVIQENSTGLEIETSWEMSSHVNDVGLKLYNLLDGKLIYSKLEPTVYCLEI